jgi:hypothetical protein
MDIPKLYLWKINQATLSTGYPNEETKSLYKEILERKRKENDEVDPYVFEVVDGQQRIRTILEYMGEIPPSEKVYRGIWHEPFPALEDTPVAKGKKYSQLNAEQHITFEESRITVMVLENATIDEIRDMFLRLQNGTPLNAQQKRDALGSEIGRVARDLAQLPFLAYFKDPASSDRLIASQMLHVAIRDKVVSCTSRQLDKLYKNHKNVAIDKDIVSKVKNAVILLGRIFASKSPDLNRSYALSLYWALSRVLETYSISEQELTKIRKNFENLNKARVEAMQRDFASDPGDELYQELTQSMSRGTDGADGISSRHQILSQFLFREVHLNALPKLDPYRSFTFEEKLILYRRADGLCELECSGVRCGRPIEFDDAVVDHIMPHSKGGTTTLENGRIAYNSCNIARGNREDFNPVAMCHRLGTAGGQVDGAKLAE